MAKKFITTMIIETPYDPSEAGNVELIMDLSSGEAKLTSRVTVEVIENQKEESDSNNLTPQKGT